MNSAFASIGLLVVTLATTAAVHAGADIQVTTTTPRDVRMLPGSSAGVSVIVTNLGPDAADTILGSVIYWLYRGYTVSLPQPNCGVLTQGGGNDVRYTVTLATIPSGESVTCDLIVARDTTPYAASDLLLVWSVPDDSNPMNNYVYFLVGSLIDVAISVEPQSFEIDGDGIAHGVVNLHAANHGPSNVAPFSVGACTDFGFPGFNMDGDFESGCGLPDYGPSCFEIGFGFPVPALMVGQEYKCSIRLTSILPYEGLLSWGIYTDVLLNPDTQGGSLMDVDTSNNEAALRLAPFRDPIFASGFEL